MSTRALFLIGFALGISACDEPTVDAVPEDDPPMEAPGDMVDPMDPEDDDAAMSPAQDGAADAGSPPRRGRRP